TPGAEVYRNLIAGILNELADRHLDSMMLAGAKHARRWWDSNPHTPFRYKGIRETLCQRCQICRGCRGDWQALARAGRLRRSEEDRKIRPQGRAKRCSAGTSCPSAAWLSRRTPCTALDLLRSSEIVKLRKFVHWSRYFFFAGFFAAPF